MEAVYTDSLHVLDSPYPNFCNDVHLQRSYLEIVEIPQECSQPLATQLPMYSAHSHEQGPVELTALFQVKFAIEFKPVVLRSCRQRL